MNDSSPPSLPEIDTASSVPESVAAGAGSASLDVSHLPEAHRGPVRRLYRRVEQAVDTIERLRTENERLRERIRELEERPALPDAETILALTDDPEALRERIDGFIDVIEAYLDATAPADDGAESPSS